MKALFNHRSIPAAALSALVLFGAADAQTSRDTARSREDSAQKAAAAANPDPASGFYAATDATQKAFKAGKLETAETLAKDLLSQAEKWEKNWNYGNAVHFGNLVLGHVALKRGKTADAKAYLLKAGKISGSPQLNTFGPNMLLASELLAKGEKDVVLEYLELTRAFWSPDLSKIDEWKPIIEGGKFPDFGPNLRYGF